jgi:hypothetical protein
MPPRGAPGAPNRRQQERREAERWKVLLRKSSRLTAAFGIEADVCTSAASSPIFARAFEGSQFDTALLLQEFIPDGLPDDPTDRFYTLWEQYQNSRRNILIPADIKSFAYAVRVVTDEFDWGWRTTKYLSAAIRITPAQYESCQVLIISPVADSEWIAFVPRFYFQKLFKRDPTGHKVYLGTLPVAMARVNPMPPVLAPFVMRKTDANEASDNYLAHYNDHRVRLYVLRTFPASSNNES